MSIFLEKIKSYLIRRKIIGYKSWCACTSPPLFQYHLMMPIKR